MSKIELRLSENRILEMFKSMQADIPQATLNNWMYNDTAEAKAKTA